MEKIVVDEVGNLNVVNEPQPAWLRIPAVFISYLFHPLFLIGWISLYIIFLNENIYMGAPAEKKVRTLLSIFSSNIFLPLVTVLLLKGLGFAQSIQLKTQKERVIPYVACITFFFWSYYVARNLHYPLAMKGFLMGVFLSACFSLLLNIYMKVSMHAMGVGGLVALAVWMLFNNLLGDGFFMAVAFLIAGITCTSRLVVSDHRPVEIYTGFIAGFTVQLLAFLFA